MLTAENYRIDFVLSGERQYAIEVLGHTYHGQLPPEAFESEVTRQQITQANGFADWPVTVASIENGEALLLTPLLDPSPRSKLEHPLHIHCDQGRAPTT